MDLKNKIILILGGTGSIGGAAAGRLEREGATVIRHGLSSGEWRADLSMDGESEKLVKKVLDTYGRIDVVINAVSAPLNLVAVEKKKWPDFTAQLNVQLRAAIEITSAVLPAMKASGGGTIMHILTAGIAHNPPPSHMADYLTAKCAVQGFAWASGYELSRFGIKVLSVNPKFIKNDFTREMPEKAVEIMEQKGEVTTPEEVAEEILKKLM